jgi:histidyl-tRNA synthetase
VAEIPRYMRDLLPPDSERFAEIERVGSQVIEIAGYRRIITPMFENTDTFSRGVGESTDIVNKEMYTFTDRSDHSLTLRPEGTAPVVRAIVTNHLDQGGLPVKLYYAAAMFRYEKPQKGRYRQHHQLGIEALGSEDPALDVEVVSTGWNVLQSCGITEMTLLLNSMGHPGDDCRNAYQPALRAFLEQHREQLDADCKRRMEQNPLRVFDCKVPADQAILADAPLLEEFLCDACKDHIAQVQSGLKDLGIPYQMAPRLVRGFDYYTRTTFEYQSQSLDAAQNAVGGGGRYDGLVQELGGPALPGIGFGLGIERIMLAQEAAGIAPPGHALACLVVPVTPDEKEMALGLLRALRGAGLRADVPYVERSLKSNLKHANRIGARMVAIVGPADREAGTCTLRIMDSGEQKQVPIEAAVRRVQEEHDAHARVRRTTRRARRRTSDALRMGPPPARPWAYHLRRPCRRIRRRPSCLRGRRAPGGATTAARILRAGHGLSRTPCGRS